MLLNCELNVVKIRIALNGKERERHVANIYKATAVEFCLLYNIGVNIVQKLIITLHIRILKFIRIECSRCT